MKRHRAMEWVTEKKRIITYNHRKLPNIMSQIATHPKNMVAAPGLWI